VTTLAEVVEGLRVTIDTIPDLRVYDYVPGDANFPAAIVNPPTITDYHDDLDVGGFQAFFGIDVLVDIALDRKQLQLYPFIERTGASSIFATLKGQDLGFADVSVHVVGLEPLEQVEIGGKRCIGSRITVQVFAGG
jgi:hypothetical protein